MNAASARIPPFESLLEAVKKLNKPPTPVGKAGIAFGELQISSMSAATECEGDLHIGVFFDGTGNNKDADYGPENNPKPFLERKHSNVVRLYNMFPDETLPWRKEKLESDKNQFRRIYVPGIGTPFKEIGEKKESGLGGGTGAGGEQRILWAMIQVLNAVHEFYTRVGNKLITDAEAFDEIKSMAQGTGKKDALTTMIVPALGAGGTLYNLIFTDNGKRKKIFKNWIDSRLVIPKTKPTLRKIYIYPFGFSRGAAEARVFSRWMVELMQLPSTTVMRLKEIPVYIPFLGIFDTVASVGVAGLYSLSEGRWGWADNTLEISNLVKECVHMVAAHEIRACFPLDTVRKDGRYPGNCEEIVYPGAHSDVGGGYAFNALGKDDVEKPSSSDLQISRVPGFDMYLRAKASGVPFYSVEQIRAQGRDEIAKDLLPDPRTITQMQEYVRLTNIGALPVEEQLKRHTSLFHYFRWKQGANYPIPAMTGNEPLNSEYTRLVGTKDGDKGMKGLARTQREFMAVLAAYVREMKRRREQLPKKMENTPLDNTLSPWSKIKRNRLKTVFFSVAVGGDYVINMNRQLEDKTFGYNALVALDVIRETSEWRSAMWFGGEKELHDAKAPEREAMWLLMGLLGANMHSEENQKVFADFFSSHVHDSMAGFDVPEFPINGYGIAKFRRLYYGNNGDKFARLQAEERNGTMKMP